MSTNARTYNYRRISHICKKKHHIDLHGYNQKQKAGDDNSGASDGTEHLRATVANLIMSVDVHHAMVRLPVFLSFLLK